MDVVIVGAGLGGLSAACHLAGAGHEVLVVERDQVPGGRAGAWHVDGFRFETGPTVLTMPEILGDTFAAAGASIDDHLTLQPLDPLYRCTFHDGSELRVRRDRQAMADEIRSVCGATEARSFERFASWLEKLWSADRHFIERNYDGVGSLFSPLWPGLEVMRLGGFRKLSNKVASFFDDTRLRQVFSFQSLYAGVSPYEALALYAVITYCDVVNGVTYPEGGIHEVPVALAQAAEKAGATFVYDCAAERIVRTPGRHGRVKGVRLANGEVVRADAVVVNAEMPGAYRHLLPELAPPRRLHRGRYSPSCVLWLAGVRGELAADVGHHNLHFGEHWKQSFDELMGDGRRMDDPALFITAAGATDATTAPPGCAALYILEPVPNLDGRVDWSRERSRVRATLEEKVASLGYPTNVTVERVIDPTDWERQGFERGTPFSLAHTFRQTAVFRPSNVERRAPGVFFAGCSTYPGVGVPMVLLSGRLAAERVSNWERARWH